MHIEAGVVDGAKMLLSYGYGDFNFLYAYGDFSGDADSRDVKEHIVEQNIGATYEHNEFLFGLIYTIEDDKEATAINGGDWNNLRALLSYNF